MKGGKGDIVFTFFSSAFLGKNKCFPGKKFKNLHAVMAILVLFESFLGKFCLNFLTLNLSASPNMMHFVRTFLIMRA